MSRSEHHANSVQWICESCGYSRWLELDRAEPIGQGCPNCNTLDATFHNLEAELDQ